jgi:hypothetical protein
MTKWSRGGFPSMSSASSRLIRGFPIAITDVRGVMIAHNSSPTWLYKNLNNLELLNLMNWGLPSLSCIL